MDAELSAEGDRPVGNKLYHGQRQGVTFALADALCWLLASRCQILDVLELENAARKMRTRPKDWRGPCSSSATCATRRQRKRRAKFRASAPSWSLATTRHPAWDETSTGTAFWRANWKNWKRPCRESRPWRLDVLGRQMAAIQRKAGPCAGCAGSSEFLRLQSKLTMCLTGSRLAKDRAADTVSKVMIPEALDYPAAGPA